MSGWPTRDDIAFDLDALGRQAIGGAVLQVVDPVTDWLNLMQTQFDFYAIRDLLRRPDFSMRFDAMNAVTGLCAHAPFEQCLGPPDGTFIRGRPLDDFGGIHPDPHPDFLAALIAATHGTDAVSFAAVSGHSGGAIFRAERGVILLHRSGRWVASLGPERQLQPRPGFPHHVPTIWDRHRRRHAAGLAGALHCTRRARRL